MSTLLQIRQVAHLMEHDMQPAKPHAKEHTNNPVQRPHFRGQGTKRSVFIKVEVPVVEIQTRESRFGSSSSGCKVVVHTTPCNSSRLSRAKKAQW